VSVAKSLTEQIIDDQEQVIDIQKKYLNIEIGKAIDSKILISKYD
jgi:hypothetical protein